ncbi:MAG TPA: O-antigen ligase family protein [Thermoanaerobaculia bacterium]|nr:O-antigen ligase family protein [Thermoanaerobaculia bacterium]
MTTGRSSLAAAGALLLTLLAGAAVPAGASLRTWLVITLVALCGTLLGAWRPDGAVLALAFLAPLSPGLSRLGGNGIPLLFLFAAPALGAGLVVRGLNGEASPLPRPLLKWSLAFLAVAAASALSSIVRGETLWRLLHDRTVPHYVNALWGTSAERSRDAVLLFLGDVLLLAAVDAFARLAGDAAKRARLLAAASAGGALALASVPLERFLPPAAWSAYWRDLGRLSGSFTDPNALGIGAALLVPIAVATLFEERTTKGGRIAAVLVLVLVFPALEASGSRTGFLLLGVAAALAIAGLVRARIVPLRVVGMGLAAVLLLSVAVWPLLPTGGSVAAGGLVSRLAASVRGGTVAGALTQRTVFWRGAFDIIAEEPLSGCGLGGFFYEFPVRFAVKHEPVDFTDNPTNALLDVAAESGLPALLLALAAIIPVLVRAWETALTREVFPIGARAAGAALVGLAVASMTGLHLRFPEVGVLAALLAALLLATGEPEGAPDPDLAAPKRVGAVLAAAGILASLLTVFPTWGPEAAFRAEPWVGLYRPELRSDMSSHRWMGPVALRRVRPGETSLALRLANGRPDDLPVTLSVEVDGSSRPGAVVPKNGEATLSVTDLRPGQIIRLAARPTFVPGEGPLGRDDRTLSIMVLIPAGWRFP